MDFITAKTKSIASPSPSKQSSMNCNSENKKIQITDQNQSLYLPISPVNLGDDLHLQVVRLVLGERRRQQLPPAFQQAQHHLPQRGEFVFFAFLQKMKKKK